MTRTLAMLAAVPPACAPRPPHLEPVTTGIFTAVQVEKGAACERLLGAPASAGVPVP
jgi:hypothetical protein